MNELGCEEVGEEGGAAGYAECAECAENDGEAGNVGRGAGECCDAEEGGWDLCAE
jgi:hypothetical protein